MKVPLATAPAESRASRRVSHRLPMAGADMGAARRSTFESTSPRPKSPITTAMIDTPS